MDKTAGIGIFIALILAIVLAGTAKFYLNKGLNKAKVGQLK